MNIERITLYHYPTTRSARVKWLLHELLDESFDVVRVELFEREQYAPAFMALNPNHAVPTVRIETGDGRGIAMFESGAIITMLADAYPDKQLAPPPSPFSPARADYLQMIHFCGTTIDMMLWQMRVHLHLLPEAERHEATVARYRIKFATEIEPQLRDRLAAHPFICGEAFCAADCVSGHIVRWAQRYGLCVGLPFQAYLARLAERPAYCRAFADAGDVTQKAAGQVSTQVSSG